MAEIDEQALQAGFLVMSQASHRGELGKSRERDWQIFRSAIEAYEAVQSNMSTPEIPAPEHKPGD